jgi:hypothetical protein
VRLAFTLAGLILHYRLSQLSYTMSSDESTQSTLINPFKHDQPVYLRVADIPGSTVHSVLEAILDKHQDDGPQGR